MMVCFKRLDRGELEEDVEMVWQSFRGRGGKVKQQEQEQEERAGGGVQ